MEGLYLLTDRGGDKPDLLVAICADSVNYWTYWRNPWFWRSKTTEVGLYNVTDPLNAEPAALLSMDGQLISSRRIGDVVYVVTRHTSEPEGFNPYPRDQMEEDQNVAVLEKAELSDLLPAYSLDGQGRGALVQARECFLPPHDEDVIPAPFLITVTAIPLSDPGNPVSQTIIGPSETIYASTDALYLATTPHEYSPPTAFEPWGIWMTPPPESTDLHKFNLTESGPVYRGSGSAPGNLGWEEEKKSFRMSHYNGVMRIATSTGDFWGGASPTRLTLFRENPDATGDVLEEISNIDGIGEVGESLYAVRFLGARAYLVTFQAFNPLYVFDLSDPENPLQMGELHIDGYSDYLHPIGETLLLGIGRDAVQDESSTDEGGRGAWIQSVKLSLFDVSDPYNPLEVDSLVYGKRGTGSEALTDHHALAYLPPINGAPARLALPIELHETLPPYYGYTNYFTYYFAPESIDIP
ncbi:MAG: hypothetical protein GY859_11885, partial [Desulfobacterales bacterium]|nr:hypothetical protein [Desulfobacterales bacterium]